MLEEKASKIFNYVSIKFLCRHATPIIRDSSIPLLYILEFFNKYNINTNSYSNLELNREPNKNRSFILQNDSIMFDVGICK